MPATGNALYRPVRPTVWPAITEASRIPPVNGSSARPASVGFMPLTICSHSGVIADYRGPDRRPGGARRSAWRPTPASPPTASSRPTMVSKLFIGRGEEVERPRIVSLWTWSSASPSSTR